MRFRSPYWWSSDWLQWQSRISRTAYSQSLLQYSNYYQKSTSSGDQQVIKFVDNLFQIFITQITLDWQKDVILQLLFMDWIHGPMRYLLGVSSSHYAPTGCDNCIYTSYRIFSCIYDIPISSQFSLRMPWTVLLPGRT
jgi:hypothetical protein